MTFGRTPEKFADYWLARFPRLLTHVWHAMHCIKNEPELVQYFDKNYDFLQVSSSEKSVLLSIRVLIDLLRGHASAQKLLHDEC